MQKKLFFLLFIAPFIVLSQISITGKVIDQSTNDPLPFATVKGDNNSYALASATGEFVIRCKSYPIQLTVSYIGYKTKTFSIQSEDVIKVEIGLIPKQENLDAVKIDIAGDGTITIRAVGAQPNETAIVDRIKLVNPEASALYKNEQGFFKSTEVATFDEDLSVSLQTGSLEGSNVSVVEELTNMIELSRRFEVQIKLMSSVEERGQALDRLLQP